jgi:hypothetical protein
VIDWKVNIIACEEGGVLMQLMGLSGSSVENY